MIPYASPWQWWSRVLRFAFLRTLPRRAEEVPTWAMVLPYVEWNTVVRHDGRTFEELQTSRLSPLARRLLPTRAFYLLFLLLWPWVSWMRSLRRGAQWYRYWRFALGCPEHAVLHPRATHTPDEERRMRPDFSIGMYYAWCYRTRRDEFFALDDKRHFAKVCAREGLALPATFVARDAIARGGTFIAKDPRADLGYGVARFTADEIRALGDDADELIYQEELRNHPELLRVFSETAPLSSFRVITFRPDAHAAPRVMRCAIRIGRAGAVADNTAQGGIWASIDRETGVIAAGVTKRSFGSPERVATHPDTGRTFAGMVVPWFDEGRRMAIDAHARLCPEALTAGWDIALAATGPVFLEVNLWTTCYDYDPPDDALSPVCEAIATRLC
jgi:hypothetical protein